LLLSQSEVNERAYGPAAGGKETSWEEEIDATGGEETHGMEWKTPVTLIIFLVRARNS
jgi:hypothetical protein